MKKLLSLLAVSTLVGTSTSSLKPVFTNSVVSHGFKSNQVNNKDISIRGNNDNPFINPIINAPKNILSLSITFDGTIWVGTDNGLYKSVDGKTFNKVMKGFNVNTILTKNNGTIWVGDGTCLYKSTDNGINFDKIIKNPNDVVNCWKFAPNGTIWASSNIGLYKSTDEKTLTSIQLIGTAPKTNLEISLNGSIYVSVNGDGWDNSGLYKSVDGEKFNKISSLSGKEWLQKNKNINAVKSSNNGTIYVGTETGLYKSTDGILFNEIANMKVQCITNGSDGTIWVGTDNGLYKSVNGTIFNKIANNKSIIYTVKNAPNGTIYVGEYQGLYKIDLIDNLLTLNQPNNYIGDKYDGFVYKNEQKLDFKEQYLKSAMLDGNSITVPSTDVNIPVGEHTLILTLKDEYKKYLDLFSGDVTTGQVTYKLWIKTSVDKSKISYETNQDTDLLSGLVSDLGNTNGCDIIQTKAKSGTHNATLKTLFSSKMLDEKNSFYVQGNVDSNNDFTETGTHQHLDLTKTEINIDGIYKMHLVDVVGNVYDSYYELGQNNWKIKGTFSDNELNKLSVKLNVTVNLTDPTQKQEAMGWLQKYQSSADSTFNSAVSTKGKGFNLTINDLPNGYKEFLDPVTYVDSKTPFAINQSKLINEITKIAEQKLQDGLSRLPQNLNVDTKNVVNKSTLNSYTSWINAYNNFINNHKDQWINDIVSVASRGFATSQQYQDIKNHITGLDFKNYLQHLVWTANSNLSTSNDYKQFVELDKLQQDTITWVNQNIPEINTAYQNEIKDAETGLELHGYSISEILNGKKLPQTKGQIDNFADGQSFHDWLQAKADNMYHIWQLKVGLPIGLILLGVTVFASLACYWKFSARHNPIKRAKKTFKPIPDKNIKKKNK